MSLRDFSAERLTLCVVARFFAERSHDLCRCEAFLAERLTHCVIARFFAERSQALCRCEIFLRSISRVVLLRDFSRGAVSRIMSL